MPLWLTLRNQHYPAIVYVSIHGEPIAGKLNISSDVRYSDKLCKDSPTVTHYAPGKEFNGNAFQMRNSKVRLNIIDGVTLTQFTTSADLLLLNFITVY